MPLVSVDFGPKNWSSSVLAGKTGIGPKTPLVEFGRKKWVWSVLVGKNGLHRFWLEKLGFDVKEGFRSILAKILVCVNFGRKNWLLTGKTGFGRFWPKKWFSSILTEKTGFDRKTGFGQF